MTTPDPGLVGLHADVADDLARTLALLEDWLLVASDAIHHDLTRFAGWTHTDGDPDADALYAFLATLGDAGVALGRARRQSHHSHRDRPWTS